MVGSRGVGLGFVKNVLARSGACALEGSHQRTPQTADKTSIRRFEAARSKVGCYPQNDERQPDREQPSRRSRMCVSRFPTATGPSTTEISTLLLHAFWI